MALKWLCHIQSDGASGKQSGQSTVYFKIRFWLTHWLVHMLSNHCPAQPRCWCIHHINLMLIDVLTKSSKSHWQLKNCHWSTRLHQIKSTLLYSIDAKYCIIIPQAPIPVFPLHILSTLYLLSFISMNHFCSLWLSFRLGMKYSSYCTM